MKLWALAIVIVAAFSCKKKESHGKDLRTTLDAQREAVVLVGGYVTCEGYAEREQTTEGCENPKGEIRGGFVCKGDKTSVVTCPPTLYDPCSTVTPKLQ
jgi:hypothetical protein